MLDQMNIVIVGHVDHGKSTFVGRLLSDSGSLPEGKLEQVKATCERNAKPFEYAFLLDALKDEQSQGITIDSARCFFKSKKRAYIIIDAPGHIEFLKNMVTGAARAEAALLLIDAKEGIQENSKRHGYMLSLLGIKQIVVLVNKMDLVGYQESRYQDICQMYGDFLKQFDVYPKAFIPISAMAGECLVGTSENMPWYQGPCVLDQMDMLQKAPDHSAQSLRFPVQDIYKFTQQGDDRRIVAGTLASGSVSVGDEVVFFPSKKTSHIQSIESFNTPVLQEASTGMATGVTLNTQIYIKPGEIMIKKGDPEPYVSNIFKASLFWLGKKPMVPNTLYKLKLATSRVGVELKEIRHILDASELKTSQKSLIERHDVGECLFQTRHPIAFDLSTDHEQTGRFVIIDDYEIAGGGIITQWFPSQDASLLTNTQATPYPQWEKSSISTADRAKAFGQTPCLILMLGSQHFVKPMAISLESSLHALKKQVAYIGFNQTTSPDSMTHLGFASRLLIDTGFICIAAIDEMSDEQLMSLKAFLEPYTVFVLSEQQDGREYVGQPMTQEAITQLIHSLR